MRFRTAALLLGAVAMLAATVPVFMTRRGESVAAMGTGQALGTGLWWCLPACVAALLPRSRVVVVAGLAVCLIAAVLVIPSVYRSTSSTAAFGIVFTPPYLALGLLALAAIEGVVLRLARRL